VVATKTSTGFVRVSDPASTAIDLVAYEARIGGLSRVVTVLQELAESLKAEAVVRAAATEKNIAPVQRLGSQARARIGIVLAWERACWENQRNR
jgi:hypothetical protein